MKCADRKRDRGCEARAIAEPLERRVLFAGSIQGYIWNDVNANGIWESPDTRAVGWTVYLDLNNNGKLDPGEPTAVTDTLGSYTFNNLPAGAFTVRYAPPDATWHAAPNEPDHRTVSLWPGRVVSGEDFGVTQVGGQISGTVLDATQSTPTPVAHWGVYLDTNGNGRIDPGEPWTSTDANGAFSFADLLPGTYAVRVDPPHADWLPAPGSSASFTITSDGLHASAPVSFAYKQASPPAQYQLSQLVDYFLIGGGYPADSTRQVDPGALGRGWVNYVQGTVEPDIAWGVRRIELHNPFGILTSDSSFRADQFLEAQGAGLHWLTDDFVQAWQPITRGGVEVIGYIGSPEYDPSFQALANNPAAWNARFDASIAPLVEADMSIGFDEGQTMQPGDLFSQALERLRAQGVKVYLENRPPEAASFNLSFPVIAADGGWDASDPYQNPSMNWAAKNSELQPGVVRIITSLTSGDLSNATALLSDVQSIMREGDSAAVPIGDLRQVGLALADLLTPGGRPPPPPAPSIPPAAPSPPAPAPAPASGSGAGVQPVVGRGHHRKPHPKPHPVHHPAAPKPPRHPKLPHHLKPARPHNPATRLGSKAVIPRLSE